MAGQQLEEIAKQWGVQPAVAARIAVMEWLHRRENGEQETGKPDVGAEEEE